MNFAAKLNIPFLEDSTSAWSRRGEMRDHIIHHISSFDSNILRGLGQYINHVTFLNKQWKQGLQAWFNRNVIKERNTLTFMRDHYFSENYNTLEFWIQLWFYHGMDTRPSNKSFEHLMTNIAAERHSTSDLNKFYKVSITKLYIKIIHK